MKVNHEIIIEALNSLDTKEMIALSRVVSKPANEVKEIVCELVIKLERGALPRPREMGWYWFENGRSAVPIYYDGKVNINGMPQEKVPSGSYYPLIVP